MRLIDPGNSFYRPAWRRYMITAAPLLWAGVEFRAGNTEWAMLFVVIGGYLAWNLILAWKE